MSQDRRGNGIQEVDGSIPFGSTKPFNNLARSWLSTKTMSV
jgi:hypothetical protein